MSAPPGHDAPGRAPAQDDFEDLAYGEAEVVDGVPVLEAEQPRSTGLAARLPRLPSLAHAHSPNALVQAAAAAAGGFVAGAAVLGVVQHRQRRAAALARPQRGGRVLARRAGQPAAGGVGELLQIVASRSLLVDVHLLAGPSSQSSR